MAIGRRPEAREVHLTRISLRSRYGVDRRGGLVVQDVNFTVGQSCCEVLPVGARARCQRLHCYGYVRQKDEVQEFEDRKG